MSTQNKQDSVCVSEQHESQLDGVLRKMSRAHDENCKCPSDKHEPQWEGVMRKFSRAHEEECRQIKLRIPQTLRSMKSFPTGSHYDGSWDVLGMSGYGVYTFPNGVVYEGDFEDGMFHGLGQMRYPGGSVIRGLFNKGVISNRKLMFADGLIYDEEDWAYCKMPDRRYSVEYEEGLEPAGRSNITAKMPPRNIPFGYYDTGVDDGFYDTETKSVYKAHDLTSMVRSPSKREQEWIVANCRTNPIGVMGPRSDLYEEWTVPELTLPHVPPPAAGTQMLTLGRKRSTYSYSSALDMDIDPFGSNRSSRLSTYPGYDAAIQDLEAENNLKSSISSKINSTSKILEKVRSYNIKIGKEDTHLKFTTVPKNYSELVSKNINVGFATLFRHSKELRHSDEKHSKLTIKSASELEGNNKQSNSLQDKATTTHEINNAAHDIDSKKAPTLAQRSIDVVGTSQTSNPKVSAKVDQKPNVLKVKSAHDYNADRGINTFKKSSETKVEFKKSSETKVE